MLEITYHGRKGRAKVHTTASGRKFIMVRDKGGGVKRLYEGSRFYTERTKKKGKRHYRRLVL